MTVQGKINLSELTELEQIEYRPAIKRSQYNFTCFTVEELELLWEKDAFEFTKNVVVDEAIVEKWNKEKAEEDMDTGRAIEAMNFQLLDYYDDESLRWAQDNGYRVRDIYNNILASQSEREHQSSKGKMLLKTRKPKMLKIDNIVLPGFVCLHLLLKDMWWLRERRKILLEAHLKPRKCSDMDLSNIELCWKISWMYNWGLFAWLDEIDILFANLQRYQEAKRDVTSDKKVVDAKEAELQTLINKQREMLEQIVKRFDANSTFKVKTLRDLVVYDTKTDIIDEKSKLKVAFCYACMELKTKMLNREDEFFTKAAYNKVHRIHIRKLMDKICEFYPVNIKGIRDIEDIDSNAKIRKAIAKYLNKMEELLADFEVVEDDYENVDACELEDLYPQIEEVEYRPIYLNDVQDDEEPKSIEGEDSIKN